MCTCVIQCAIGGNPFNMAASSASCVASSSNVPELPETPHQPLSFGFPKRYYGKKSTVACTFQSSWFKSWPFLHYDEAQDVVFCHTCVKAFSLKRMITSPLIYSTEFSRASIYSAHTTFFSCSQSTRSITASVHCFSRPSVR